MTKRLFLNRGRGFGLAVLIIVVAALGAATIGILLFTSKMADMSSENQTIKRMEDVRDKAERFFRGNETLPAAESGFQTDLTGGGSQDTAVPVDVDALNMKTLYRMDAWEQGLVFYVAPSSTKGNGLAGVKLFGTNDDAAGFVLSYGPNQQYESTLALVTTGTDPYYVLTLDGDDIVVPINVKDEALEIVNEELQVLARKQCAYRIASAPPGYWHLFDDSPGWDGLVMDWPNFLSRYGLSEKYRTDPWAHDYNLQYTDQISPVRFWSEGVDTTATTDRLYSEMLTNDRCESALVSAVPEPLLHYDFEGAQINQTDGTISWTNSDGNPVTGSLAGNVSVVDWGVSGAPAKPEGGSPSSSRGVYFDGAGAIVLDDTAYFNIAGSLAPGDENGLTLSAWVYPVYRLDDWAKVMSRRSGSNFYFLGTNNSGAHYCSAANPVRPYGSIGNGSGWDKVPPEGTANQIPGLACASWYHLTFVYHRNVRSAAPRHDMNLYVYWYDGLNWHTEFRTQTTNRDLQDLDNLYLIIGADGQPTVNPSPPPAYTITSLDHFFQGYMDEIWVFDEVLTETQIKNALCQCPAAP